MPHLDLSADVVTLTQQLVDIESVSHHEQEIADAVEAALLALPHLTVTRRGHTVVARTALGRGERVVLAGHLDTVPLNDNLPSRLEDGILHGLGSCDMKGGDAVMLKLAADVTEPNRDLTFIFYEAEGTARDLVRAVQQARKDAGLQVSDRIALTVSAPASTLDAARTHEALIADETLATSVSYADAAEVSVEVVRA